jgi:hypothetical protein
MTNLPSHPAGTRPSRAALAEVTDCLDRMDRRMKRGCATAAGLFAVGGTGASPSAVHQYAVVHDGSMASAGAALATALFGPRPGSRAAYALSGAPECAARRDELPLTRSELRPGGGIRRRA